MKADFSRLTFDRRQHYAGVLQQQGRVWTDADVNEWVEIVLDRFRTQSRDAFGAAWRPDAAAGFKLAVNGTTVTIGAGRLYVDGMLAELDAAAGYDAQIDFPFPAQTIWARGITGGAPQGDWPGIAAADGSTDLFYVEVWQRHLTALNDEAERDDVAGAPDWNAIPSVGDYIRERALGGVDTCTRLRTVAQVKRWPLPNGVAADCATACAELKKTLTTDGTLLVTVPPIPPVVDPCQQPLDGGYNGRENALYRVEIHTPGNAGTATFKWSNENGAMTVRVNAAKPYVIVPAGTALTLRSVGRDQQTQLQSGNVVELCGEDTELGVWRNALAQIVDGPTAQPDGTWQVKLDADVLVPRAPFLRRWNAKDAPIPALGTQAALDVPAEIDVQFFDTGGATTGTPFFRAMDYWTFSARTLTREIEPPDITQVAQHVRGIDRAVTCLALVAWSSSPAEPPTGFLIDCLPPPQQQDTCGCCCTAVVRPPPKDQQGRDETPVLRAAVASLPREGGTICIDPGFYALLSGPVIIDRPGVTIRGCGERTRIFAPQGAFVAETVASLTRIEDLAIHMFDVPAIVSDDGVQGIAVVGTSVTAEVSTRSYAYSLSGLNLLVERNHVVDACGVEIRTGSAGVTIARNVFERGIGRAISLGSPVTGPANDQFVRTVRIRDNEIRDMAAEAIAMPFWVENEPVTLIVADDLRIDGNLIERCLADRLEGVGFVSHGLTVDGNGHPTITTRVFEAASMSAGTASGGTTSAGGSAPPPSLVTNVAPVFLPIAQRVEIEDNRIFCDAAGLATSGIAFFLGLGVAICDNHVTQLGQNVVPAAALPVPRAGISMVALHPSIPVPGAFGADPNGVTDPLLAAGAAALRVAGNIVQIEGAPAIALLGIGTVSITDNDLARRGPPFPGELALAAGQVNIDAPVVECIVAGSSASQGGLAAFSSQHLTAPTQGFDESTQLVAGELVFDGNRCLLDLAQAQTEERAAIVALVLGDASVQHNVSRVVILGSMLTNGLLYATTLRCSGNRFDENSALFSCWGASTATVAVGNSGSHCFSFTPWSTEYQIANLVDPAGRSFCDSVSVARGMR